MFAGARWIAGRHNKIDGIFWWHLLLFISRFLAVFTVELAKQSAARWRCWCRLGLQFQSAQSKFGLGGLWLLHLHVETLGLQLLFHFGFPEWSEWLKGTCVWRNRCIVKNSNRWGTFGGGRERTWRSKKLPCILRNTQHVLVHVFYPVLVFILCE